MTREQVIYIITSFYLLNIFIYPFNQILLFLGLLMVFVRYLKRFKRLAGKNVVSVPKICSRAFSDRLIRIVFAVSTQMEYLVSHLPLGTAFLPRFCKPLFSIEDAFFPRVSSN